MFGYFGDFDSRTKQRQKLKQEIDQLLESEQTTVATLFSLENQEKQDEIMNQLRWGNKKVCQFFDKKRVAELMEYLTIMPPQDSSHDRGHKFPFLANQIFIEGGKGVESIVDHFFFSKKQQNKSNSSLNDIKKSSNEDQYKQTGENSPVKLTNPFKTIGENYFFDADGEDDNLNRDDQNQNEYKNSSPLVEVEQEEDFDEDEFHDLEFQINEEADLKPTPIKPDNKEKDQQGKIPEEEEQKAKNEEPSQAQSILQNIQSLVSMLGGSSTEERNQINKLEEMKEEIKEQENQLQNDINTLMEAHKEIKNKELPENEIRSLEMLEKLANKQDTKKSFEMKLVTDDENDEIFIVHEEDDDQDEFFVNCNESPKFDEDYKPAVTIKPNHVIAQSEVNQQNTELEDGLIGQNSGVVENPFKNNLFNSEQIPTTQKLDVEIKDNYIEPSNQQPIPTIESLKIDQSVIPEMSTHSENIMKRRKQNKEGKKHNISFHQFDDDTQKGNDPVIALVGAQPPSSINQVLGHASVLSNTMQGPNTIPLKEPEDTGYYQSVTAKKEEFKMVQLVEDHIQVNNKINNNDEIVINVPLDEDDNFNDREDTNPLDSIKEPVEVKVIEADGLDGDNGTLEFQDIEDINASKEEQESIELIETTEEQEKKQDYKLLDQLFSFLDPNSSGFDSQGLNLTLSGYFCKVVQVLMQKQPKEFIKYIQYTEYQVFNKLMNHLENKSICELFIKMLNDLAERNQSLPGIPDVQAVLQQSGQSGDGDPQKTAQQKQQTQADNISQVQLIIIRLLDEKICEETDVLEKMGAFEIIQSLLQKKTFYQTMTSQKAFSLMTKRLVSGDEDTMRFIYQILLELIWCFEKHERLEKRINIDNLFEDDELFNEHSGSFHDGKKSRNSKKNNQEVLKDVQESELFHFFTVVIQEVTASAIEDRFEQLQAAEDSRVPLGQYFLALIQFLEKASSTFCGFAFDINHMIIEKELFLYLFDIMEYYRFSDILLKSIFKILENIIKAKNDDAQEMVRYMIEDTPLIKFLINNKPSMIVREPSARNNSSGETKEISSQAAEEQKEEIQANEEGNQTKSPEQSKSKSQILQEKSKKEENIQIHQLATTSGIQAFSKGVASIIHQFYLKDKQSDSRDKIHKSGGPENSQQSGDQSKSSLVETEEEIHAQKVSKIVVAKLKDNEEWRAYATNCIEPILELEKGKLGHESEKKSEKDDSNGNIFDDDFIRSDFGVENNSSGNYQNQEPTKLSQEEEEDHHKFVQKIQECFSSNFYAGNQEKNNVITGDFIDDNERDRKQKQFSALGPVDENIRNSLSDLSDENNFKPKRDRSCSNEGFELPPLPEIDDNKDLTVGDDQDGILTENYQSNELSSKNLVYFDQLDPEQQENQDQESPVQPDQLIQENLSTQNQGPQSIFDANDDLERDDDKIDQDLFKNFENYEADILREMKHALADDLGNIANDNIPHYSDADLEAEIEIKSRVGGSQKQEIDEYNSIFDKMDAEDNENSVIPTFGSDNLMISEIPQTIEDIQNDFPGVLVQENNFFVEEVKQQEKEQEPLISNTLLDQIQPTQLTKSVYVPKQSPGNNLLTLEEKPEFQDNQFWDLHHSHTLNYQLDDLLEDYD